MADLNEPKKETVRITLPPESSRPPAAVLEDGKPRINLPNRFPGLPGAGKPSASSLRPPSAGPVRPPPPSAVAPKPLPSNSGLRPPAPPMARPPAPTPGAVRPARSSMPTPAQSPLTSGTKMPEVPSLTKTPPPGRPLPASPAKLENHSATLSGPRKETARIADSSMKATVRLSSVQPLLSPPDLRHPPVVANSQPARLVDSVPTSLCWGLLAASTLALLTQLWTYLS